MHAKEIQPADRPLNMTLQPPNTHTLSEPDWNPGVKGGETRPHASSEIQPLDEDLQLNTMKTHI